MKAKCHLAIALIIGAAIGGAAIQRLHAQATPRAYVLIENSVTNQEAYTKTFLPVIGKIISDSGGRFLARGGKIISIRGEPPKPLTMIDVIAYENLEKAQAAYFSPVWNDARKISDAYSTARIIIVEGVPQ